MRVGGYPPLDPPSNIVKFCSQSYTGDPAAKFTITESDVNPGEYKITSILNGLDIKPINQKVTAAGGYFAYVWKIIPNIFPASSANIKSNGNYQWNSILAPGNSYKKIGLKLDATSTDPACQVKIYCDDILKGQESLKTYLSTTLSVPSSGWIAHKIKFEFTKPVTFNSFNYEFLVGI
jgi:hypothetical protein